jgi:2-dehydro-3-deoxyphosphooctonate aldolase (KDO 8-P synthase)
MDCTHSVQKPGGQGASSGGNRDFVPYMAKAAKAFDVDGYFLEIHPDPEKALSDGPNMVKLEDVEKIIKSIL